MATKTAFATVGTTQFDKFIEKLTTSEVLTILKEKGYDKLKIQIGNGSYEPPAGNVNDIDIEYYRYKNSLQEDMQTADLILSHAGAGSCLEALEAGKPLLVIVNEDLMNNHQTELAEQFHKEGYLYYCNCDKLAYNLKNCNFNNLNPYIKGNAKLFTQFLDNIMNFSE